MKEVMLLLCKGTEIFEAAAFYDVLGWSGSYGAEPVRVVPVASDIEVRCTFGLTVKTEARLCDVKPEDFDALAIPGGFESFGFYDEAYSKDVADLIRRFADLGKPIASICVGALPVAHSGILAGKRATTYHLMDGRRRKQLAEFGAEVVDAPMVYEDNIATSTSPATAVDVAFWLLEQLTSPENANRIRHLMGFD